MKARIYTLAMLIALNIGFISVQGQRPVRSETRAGERGEKETSEQIKPETRQEASRQQPVSSSRSYQKQSQVAHQAKHHSRAYDRKNTPRQKQVETKAYRKQYYSGHHYHHVHPSSRIKTHYHRDTYLHNYRVLYYPAYHEIYWTRGMYHDYRKWYPQYRWRYNYGHRIQTISAFDARYNMGEVAMVFGRVSASWYNRDSDDYLLFFGGDYPNQAFTLVMPGRIARKHAWRPERYFLGEHVTVTGLITTYDGIPEIIVKNKRQVGIY